MEKFKKYPVLLLNKRVLNEMMVVKLTGIEQWM
jgi:hypothetical protein